MITCKRIILRATPQKPERILLAVIEKEVRGFLHIRTQRNTFEINRMDIVSIQDTDVEFIEGGP